jgi:hypothetical protein
MSENKKQKLNDSGSKTNKSLPPEIANIYSDFSAWLRTIKYSRPTGFNEILPQFAASNMNPPNIRLAAIFSIPIEQLPKMSFEDRVELWSENILHHLGDSVGHGAYRRWQYNLSMDPEDEDFVEDVKGRLFFSDFHILMNTLGEFGEKGYFEILWKVWDSNDKNEVEF